MLGNSINIKNFIIGIQYLWKKFAKTSKNYYFSTQLVQKWGPYRPHPKQKTIIFSEITKPDSKLSKPFYFNKTSYVLAELWMFFYIVYIIMLFC